MDAADLNTVIDARMSGGGGGYGNNSNDRIKDTLAKAQSMLLDDPFVIKSGGPNVVQETGNFGGAGAFGIGSLGLGSRGGGAVGNDFTLASGGGAPKGYSYYGGGGM